MSNSDAVLAGFLVSQSALVLALFLAFLLISVVLVWLFYPTRDPAVQRSLRRGVTLVHRGSQAAPARAESGALATAVGRTAIGLVSRAPKPKGYDEKLQTDIDRAGWELRASEFTALRIAAIVLGFMLVWALAGNPVIGIAGLLLGFAIPGVFLSVAKDRRQSRFMEQLPDTLQLLAGTLKAGYGLLQAIDTVVKEVDDPMAEEFQRTLTEARLGLPLEDSLWAMAERVDSDDFRWVVVAMTIQRQVGGNLAELLETVATTLRGREQIRRQVQVLSAEGRLSAYVLIAVPFFIVAYLFVVNPAYLLPLFTEAVGLLMVGFASVLLLIGIFWIRKLIRIEV